VVNFLDLIQKKTK